MLGRARGSGKNSSDGDRVPLPDARHRARAADAGRRRAAAHVPDDDPGPRRRRDRDLHLWAAARRDARQGLRPERTPRAVEPGGLTGAMAVTIYGVCAVTFMMVMYALERRGRAYVLGFAVGCVLSS